MHENPDFPAQGQRDRILRALVVGMTIGNYGLLPFHPYLSLEGSERNMSWSGMLFLATFALEFFRDRYARGRFTPSLLSFLAVNIHAGLVPL